MATEVTGVGGGTALPGSPGPWQADAEAEPGGFWSWWSGLADQPAVVETVVALVLVGSALLVVWRLLRLGRITRHRRAVEDYLLGAEQALAGDLKGASKRLRRVLDEDPENHYARLLYGRVEARRGRPAEAHKHHLVLQRAFRVDSPSNELGLAESLLATGHELEAAEAAERAAAAGPQRAESLRVLLRAQLAARQTEAAGQTGQRLLALLNDPEECDRVRRETVRALSAAGMARAGADPAAGRRLLQQARALDAEGNEVRRLAARLEAVEHGAGAAARHLLGGGATGAASLPVPAADLPMVPAVERVNVEGLQVLAGLLPASRWSCSVCGAVLAGPLAVCPACGATRVARTAEPGLFTGLGSPGAEMDALEENRAHIRRLLARARSGDDEAMDDLVGLGERAVPELFAQAVRAGDEDDPAVRALVRMGPAITGALFRTFAEVRDRRVPLLDRVRGDRGGSLLGRIVQGFGREALPWFEELLETADREQRKVLIDYFIGLGDHGEFRKILDRFPPLEVVHRLNRAGSGALVRFLCGLPRGGFLAEGLLLDPAFDRDEELFEASVQAEQPAVLQDVMVRRGPSRTLAKVLVASLAVPAGAPRACAVLDAFGAGVLDHVLAAFADLDQAAPVRDLLRERLLRVGPAAVERLCATFGPAPSALDAEVVEVLSALGPEAVPPLVAGYERVNVLERFSGGLVRLPRHRRRQIVRALTVLGARDALAELRSKEKDTDLKLALARALHQFEDAGDDGGEDGHGQAG